MLLDDKDKKIVEILKQNSRSSNVEIAKKVGLTEGAVRNRINKLATDGVISRFTIETNTENKYGVVMVKAKKDTKQLMRDIASINIVKDCYEISGEYDGCIILDGSSLDEIDQKIDRIRKLKSVAETRTFLSFKKW